MVKNKTYDKYKPSGVEWLGDVPEDWEVRKLKYLLELITNKNSDIEGIKVGLENIEGQTGRYIETKSDFEGDGVSFAENDILYGKLRPYLAKVFLSTFSGFAVGDFFVLRPNIFAFPKYFQYRLLEQEFTEISNGSTFGAKMPRVNWEFLANLKFSLPPLDEQQAIAVFLDRRTSEIDELIAKKERVIELLREKRTALISQAVTKGLNPDAKMKDSDVDWLGKIPEHWEMKRFKNLGAIIGGYAFKSNLFTTSGIRTIKINNIQQMEIDWGDTSYIPEYLYEQHKSYSVTDGSLVFALTRPIISTGIKAAIVKTDNEKILINQRTGLFRPNGKATESFLYYMVNSQYFTFGFSLKITSTNQPNISPEDIGRIYITLPSKKEQQEIADYLDRETSRIDALTAKVTEAIEKLKEYRTALISTAVTGKIDVRR